MLTLLLVLIVSVTLFVVLLLVSVVIGIRQEPPTEELSEQASSLIAAIVRRMLGLHVRKPDSPRNLDQGDERQCFARVTLPADSMHTLDPDER
jgi:hypothetical protein